MCIRSNDDDIFKDGNNFEVALTQGAVEVWEYIQTEELRRAQAVVEAAAAKKAAKALPRS